jgi:hypothetical protein
MQITEADVAEAVRTVQLIGAEDFIADLHTIANRAENDHGENPESDWFRAAATIMGAVHDGTLRCQCTICASDAVVEAVREWQKAYAAHKANGFHAWPTGHAAAVASDLMVELLLTATIRPESEVRADERNKCAQGCAPDAVAELCDEIERLREESRIVRGGYVYPFILCDDCTAKLDAALDAKLRIQHTDQLPQPCAPDDVAEAVRDWQETAAAFLDGQHGDHSRLQAARLRLAEALRTATIRSESEVRTDERDRCLSILRAEIGATGARQIVEQRMLNPKDNKGSSCNK